MVRFVSGRRVLLRLAFLLLFAVPALSSCSTPPAPDLFALPRTDWSIDNLSVYVLDDWDAFLELRNRAVLSRRAGVALEAAYDDAAVLASAGDDVAYDALLFGVRSGDVGALFHYGMFLLLGSTELGLDPQPRAAAAYLLRAEGLGSSDAAVEVCRGFVEGWNGVEVRLPPPTGPERCENLAFSGLADGLLLAGDVFREGLDVPVDFIRAVGYYELAASSGLAVAFNRLALLAERGVSRQVDIVDLVDSDAFVDGEPDFPVMIRYMVLAVQNGEFGGLRRLIDFLESGPVSVRDPVRAFAVWQEVWAQGQAAGAWGTARAFACGIGVSRSPVESEYWVGIALQMDGSSSFAERLYYSGC